MLADSKILSKIYLFDENWLQQCRRGFEYFKLQSYNRLLNRYPMRERNATEFCKLSNVGSKNLKSLFSKNNLKNFLARKIIAIHRDFWTVTPEQVVSVHFAIEWQIINRPILIQAFFQKVFKAQIFKFLEKKIIIFRWFIKNLDLGRWSKFGRCFEQCFTLLEV